MIPWVTTGNFLNGLVNYNEDKRQKDDASLLYVNTMDNSLPTFKFLYEQLTEDSRRQHNLMHISLNFHDDDREQLTKDFLVTVSEDFLHEFGFPLDQPYLIYEHRDKNHPHVHIAVPMALTTGGTINNSFTAKKMITIARRLEKKYNLKQVVEREQRVGEKATLEPAYVESRKAVQALAETVINKMPATLTEMKEIAESVSVTYNNQPAHLSWDIRKADTGITFYLADKDGNALSKGVKGSKLYGNLSLQRLTDKFEQNKLLTDLRRSKVRATLEKILNSYTNTKQPVPFQAFRTALAGQSITVAEFYTKTGSVFGIEFTDLHSGITFKGSELHKSLSWNSIKSKISGPIKPVGDIQETPTAEKEIHVSATEKSIEKTESKPTGNATIKPINIPMKNFPEKMQDMKAAVSLIDLLESHGYHRNETKQKKGTKKYSRFDGPDGFVHVYNHSPSNDNSGLFYTNPQNGTDKGDIFNFLIHRGIAGSNKEAMDYLEGKNFTFSVPQRSGTAPQPKQQVPFRPVTSLPIDNHDFIIVDRGVELDIIDTKFNGAIFSTTHENLYSDLRDLYGSGVDAFLPDIKPAANYSVFPIYRVNDLTDKSVIGQQIRQEHFKHLVQNSNKSGGVWHTYDPAKNDVAIFENPVDAISHQQLFPTFDASYFATIGTPSREVITELAKLSSKHQLHLAFDNDASGAYYNLQFIAADIALRTGMKLNASYNNDYTIQFTIEQHKSTHDKLLRELAVSLKAATVSSTENNLTISVPRIKLDKETASAADIKKADRANTKILTELNKNLIYFYGSSLKTLTSTLKDFNDDLQKQNELRPKGPKL